MTNNATSLYNKFLGSIADSRTGNPIPLISVYVYEGDTAPVALQSVGDTFVSATNGDEASLFAGENDATPVAQPLETDGDGEFELFAPYGRYDFVFVRRGVVLRVWPKIYVTGINSSIDGAELAKIACKGASGLAFVNATPHTVLEAHYFLEVDCSAGTPGNRVIDFMSAAAALAHTLTVKKKSSDNSAFSVVCTPNGSETIEGESIYEFSMRGEFMTFIPDGVDNWIRIN